MTKIARLTCICSALLAVVVWHGTGSVQAAEEGIKVEILIYSGRPNPTYVLKQKNQLDQAVTFMKKGKKLRSMQKSIIIPTLGYRGIIIENKGKVAGLPERFAIYQGNVEVMGKEKANFTDGGRAFEKFLLKEAERQKAIDQNMSRQLKINEMK
jgi:hypothetical protein